jgi:hypothetical protein
MPAPVRIGIDIGAARTCAVVALPGGPWLPLMPDGAPVLPSGVFLDPDGGHLLVGEPARAAAITRPDCYLPNPYALFATQTTAGAIRVGGRDIEATDPAAAVLRRLTDETILLAGSPPTAVVIAVPAGWGPRRRDRLQQAVASAGLTPAILVTTPLALYTHLTGPTGLSIPDSTCLLVCDAGASSLRLSVVQHTTTGPALLATADHPDSGGNTIDTALAMVAARTITDADPDTWHRILQPDNLDDQRRRHSLWQTVRAAKQALWQQDQAAVPLPKPYPPAVLDRADLAAATAPILAALPHHIDQVLAAADIDRGHLAAVVLAGGGARLPGLAETLTAATGHQPAAPARPDLAAADGALRAASPHLAHTATPAAALPTLRLRMRDLAAPILIWIASALLLWQAIRTTETWTQGVLTIVEAATDMEVIALAGALAALSTLAIGQIAVTGLLTSSPNAANPAGLPPVGPAMRRVYPGVALVGLAMAALFGMVVPVSIPNQYQTAWLSVGPYLTWSMFGAGFAALAAILITIIGPRIPHHALPDWLPVGRPPLAAVLTGSIGVLLLVAGLNGSFPVSTIGYHRLVGRAGAVLIALAVAAILTHRWLLRAAVATILAAAGVLFYSSTTAQVLRTAFLIAIAWWGTVLIGHTCRAAFPTIGATTRRWLQPTPPI